MLNFFYKNSISNFLLQSYEEVIGAITINNKFDLTLQQIEAWKQQLPILKESLQDFEGTIIFEFNIPRMGKRVDCILIIQNIVFVVEFKVGESEFYNHNIEQVWDYSLDLKNFHEPSHKAWVVPVLIATEAKDSFIEIATTSHNDNLFLPIKCNKKDLKLVIQEAIKFSNQEYKIEGLTFVEGSYSPTPTIIETAIALYNNHSVENITRNDAEVENLTKTSKAISEAIEFAKANCKKIICFVTGVPGAGKTLVGLNVATNHLDHEKGNRSVFLSGNAPLVAILQEALVRDKVAREKLNGNRITKSSAKDSIKAFIQIIHHYRDAYLVDKKAPYDHVAIFDEAQRAWNKEQTISFMKQKKNIPDFHYSEPEFLISCLDRHQDWAVIVCLVGGGQEINKGEAGISEWLEALNRSFKNWEVFISSNLTDSEYAAETAICSISNKVTVNDCLHLSVSRRSYRAENVSLFVKQLLDLKIEDAKQTLKLISHKYPIVLTRDLEKAKNWLKEKARGSERFGIVVSSQAQRLKPLAIDVKSPMNPVNWFLDGKDDVRSSYYLEDVATEFHVQGLELDWACVTWDGDFRYSENEWKTFSFVGNKWHNINKEERRKYLKNAYRVLLTRARQGMVIVVPEGSNEDPTRNPIFYDSTYLYLKNIGVREV